MDILLDKDNYVKLTQLTVKQEIYDSEYNVAISSNDDKEKSSSVDHDYRTIDKQKVDADSYLSENINRPADKLDVFSESSIIENVQLGESQESTNDTKVIEKQVILKQENVLQEDTDELTCEVKKSDKGFKQEVVIKAEGVSLNTDVDGNVVDSKTQDNETVAEGDSNYIDHYVETKISNETWCNGTALQDCAQDNTDLCKREGSGSPHETVYTAENVPHSILEKKGYVCEICKKTFIRKSSLSSHEMTHTGETPFKCQFCTKGFNVRSNLNVHLRIHTGQRPHVCEICQKTFRQAGQLKTHDRIHKGEKPYVCSLCTRSFRNSSTLITHQRTHTGERPFPCDLCSRSFSTSTSLKTHRITHSGTMLYDCPVCGRQFNRKNNLNVHIKRHNKNRKFSCPKCSNGFVMRAHILRHLRRAHKVDIPAKQVNTFLDSCKDTGGTSIKSEQDWDFKNEEELESKSTNNLGEEYHCTGTKNEVDWEEIEVKQDIDDC